MTWELRNVGWPIPYTNIDDWPISYKKLDDWPIPNKDDWPIPKQQKYYYYGYSIYLTENNKGTIISTWV